MKRALTLLMLVVSLALPLLTGRPVYRCHLTGVVSLHCGCAAQRAEPAEPACACCRRGPEADGQSSHERVTGCDCCDVQLYSGMVAPLPSKPTLDLESPCGPSLAALHGEAAHAPIRGVSGHLFAAFHSPARGGPPLYRLYSVYLI